MGGFHRGVVGLELDDGVGATIIFFIDGRLEGGRLVNSPEAWSEGGKPVDCCVIIVVEVVQDGWSLWVSAIVAPGGT